LDIVVKDDNSDDKLWYMSDTMKKTLVFILLALAGFIFIACTSGIPTTPNSSPDATPIEVIMPTNDDFDAVKASINGNWELAYRNSRITISEDGRYEESWDNAIIINGRFTIARENETDYRLAFMPDRVRVLSVNQPEFGSPQFDDEAYHASPSWLHRDIIINPSNQNRLGLVGDDGAVEWVDTYFNAGVLWLEDRI